MPETDGRSAVASAFLSLAVFVVVIAGMRAALGEPDHSLEQSYAVLENIKRHMTINMLLSALTGLVVAVGPAVLGVDFPLLWDLFTCLLNFITNIGSLCF